MVKEKIIILKTASFASAILSAKGIRIPVPIVVTTNSSVGNIMKVLENSNLRVMTSLDKKATFVEEISTVSADPFIFIYDGSFKGTSRLELIINSTKAGQCLGDEISRLPIIVTDLTIPREYLQDVFQIHIEAEEELDFDIWDMLATGDELKLVENKIGELDKSLTQTHQFLLSCIAFLYQRMRQNGLTEDYSKLEEAISDLVELDDQAKDPSGISDMFIERIYKLSKHAEKPKVWILPEVEEEVISQRDNFFFCTDTHVYVTENLFKRITGNLSKIIGINTIKQILVEEGVLCKGSKRGYLSKMSVTTMHGDPLRLDVLKFDIDKLTRTGKTDFIIEFGG